MYSVISEKIIKFANIETFNKNGASASFHIKLQEHYACRSGFQFGNQLFCGFER